MMDFSVEFKKAVIQLSKDIGSLEGATNIDSFLLASIQEELDNLEARFSDKVKSTLYYKLYELQSRIHLLNGDLEQANTFLQAALTAKGSDFPEYESIAAKIEQGRMDSYNFLNSLYKETVRRHAARGFIIGLVIGAVGIGITWMGYLSATNNPSADGTSSYIVFWGLILVGGYRMIVCGHKWLYPGDYIVDSNRESND